MRKMSLKKILAVLSCTSVLGSGAYALNAMPENSLDARVQEVYEESVNPDKEVYERMKKYFEIADSVSIGTCISKESVKDVCVKYVFQDNDLYKSLGKVFPGGLGLMNGEVGKKKKLPPAQLELIIGDPGELDISEGDRIILFYSDSADGVCGGPALINFFPAAEHYTEQLDKIVDEYADSLKKS